MKIKNPSPKLRAAIERYDEARTAMLEAADALENAPDDADADARAALGAAFDQAKAAADERKADVAKLEEIAEAREQNPAPDDLPDDEGKRGRPTIRLGREPLTYDRHKLESSYLLDLARVKTGRGDTEGARKRLERHRDEVKVETEGRDRYLDFGLTRGLEQLLEDEVRRGGITEPTALRMLSQGLVEKRAVSRIDGSAGEFVPPFWALDQYAPAIRAGRPFADRVRQLPLPSGTDSINVPIITVGGLTGFQAQDGSQVASRDWQTSSVLAPVRTLAGQLDVAMQVLEQSPIGYDQIAFGDLFADYALQVDIGCVQGTGGPGQLLGILNVAGTFAQAYTDGTPTAPEIFPKLAGAMNGVSSARKMTATHMWMHSQRYYWLASQLDSSNRPFLVPQQGGPTNAYGEFDGSSVQGPTGTVLLGAPVMLDQSIPTNLGGGTNEDRVISTVMNDHILFEGDLRARALEEVLSGTLQVRLQVYAYLAFTAGRFPAGTAVVSGTGLVTPTF